MMSSAAGPDRTFRGSRKPFREQAKTVRLPAGITIRLQPGILFVFTPESFSRSPRNPVRLAPESALETVNRALNAKPTAITVPAPEFEQDHLRLLTDKLHQNVRQLEAVNLR